MKKKFELIREIFGIVTRCGEEDNKLDQICGYTKDKFSNPVYVRKVTVENVKGVDSVAITSMSENFEDCCDSDLRIAFNDTNIGQRVFIWANEADMVMLSSIHLELVNKYGVNEDEMFLLEAKKVLHEKGLMDNKAILHILDICEEYIHSIRM